MLKKEVLELTVRKEIIQKEAGERLLVSRQTISKWLCRYRRFGEESLFPLKRGKRRTPPKNKTTEAIEDMVIEYGAKYWQDGVESLSDRIYAEQNIRIHSTTIYRILKRRGVRYFSYWTGTKKRRKKKLYSHTEAGQEIQMDTKYPFGYKIGVVVYTAIDDASRWAFAWVYETANGENTMDFIKRLIQSVPFPMKKIRTDCGTEFVNSKVRNLLESLSIEHRKNTPYCPEENGKIERFHGTLNQKSIQYYWYPSDSLDDLQYKLQLFLHYYNYQKKHRGLGMHTLTPFQKLSLLAFFPHLFSSQNVNLTLQCNKSCKKAIFSV
jgi:transposase InsO family protein